MTTRGGRGSVVVTGRAGALAIAAAPVVGVLAPSWWGRGGAVLVLLVVIITDRALAGSVQDVVVTRSGERSVRLGGTVESRLVLANTGSRRVRGEARDAWMPSAGATGAQWRIDIPAGDARAVAVRITPVRRGDRDAVATMIRSLGPLGVAGRQHDQLVPGTVRALPPFTSRKHLPSRTARLRELDGRQSVLGRGEGTEFDALREYVPGDDVRSIDWRATARSREVMVRTWRPERDRRIIIAVDSGRTSAGRVGDAPRLDAQLDAALLLAVLACRAGDRVDYFSHDVAVTSRASGTTESMLLPAMVDAMATVEPLLAETSATGIVAEVLRRARKRCLVVLVTPLEPAAIEHSWLPVIDGLLARHRVILASVADPALRGIARDRSSSDAVHAAAAAEQDLAERRRVAAWLRARGVTVVDADPEALPPALADQYLALKAAGRL
ncbi:DUF58 domain-containing protein [Hoyosella sp. G463]|uniref:DUF58 domain-containing protein n=1 Tax=Lolliginicoccus lacisalsi TaxID=2742202 RepID=A0A927J998_9ACTN|nr:DUF58 domain-containing protein [Lolliginicoccus lacisalsi]